MLSQTIFVMSDLTCINLSQNHRHGYSVFLAYLHIYFTYIDINNNNHYLYDHNNYNFYNYLNYYYYYLNNGKPMTTSTSKVLVSCSA